MNSELFSWGTRVPVSTALRGKSDLELSKEIQDSLSEVKWNMFGLEFFLVLGALLFLFTCYQVVKIGRILDEIQDKLSEVKRGERVGTKRKYGTQNLRRIPEVPGLSLLTDQWFHLLERAPSRP
jgi:hypothetical protein